MDHYYTNNSNLKSKPQVIKAVFADYTFSFTTDNGVYTESAFPFDTFIPSDALLHTFLVQL